MTIDWGDGTTPTGGTVKQIVTNSYDVSGTHTYAEEGNYLFFVTLHTSEGDVQTFGVAHVIDPAPMVTGVPVDVVRGTPLTDQRVATFVDFDPGGTVSDYSTTIDWGDGTSSTGTVVPNQGGGFAVNGNHSYTTATTYGVKVTVHDGGGGTSSAFTTVAISLPGGSLAFASTRSGKSEIWTMRADGGGQTQLTSNNAGEFFSPSWAPDGSRLAAGATVLGFQRPAALASLVLPPTVFTVQEPGVWLLNPDGSGLSRLAIVRTPAQATPAWSRDTRRIAYVDGAAPDIFGVPTGSVAFPTMFTQTKNSTGPDWSPKGDRIAYSFRPSGLGQIWTMDPDGHHQAPLFADARSNSSPTYSPDLTRLAYVGALPGDVSHIFIASASGLNPRLLTATPAIDPAWSPDGTKIAFTALNPPGGGQIHVINADGTGEQPLTDTGDNRHPSWRRSTCTFLPLCLGGVIACANCPVVAIYSLRAPAFHVGPRPTGLLARARAIPTGTAFRYTLSSKARVQITISRLRTGHRVGRRCRLGKAPRGALACLVSSRVGTLRRRHGHKGFNTTTFSGRLGRRALALGHYQAAIVVIDAKGRRSLPRLLDFDIV